MSSGQSSTKKDEKPNANPLIEHFVKGLKSRNEETRGRVAGELHHYVSTELREVSTEELAAFMDQMNHQIYEMVSSLDVNDRKGGVLAIVSLIGLDVGNTSTRISRFANYLRNLLPSNDLAVMEMAAKAVGRLALASGTYTSEYVEYEEKRVFEWLSGDRNEGRKQAGVLVLRELAVCTPTFFFQQIQQFFDCIFNAVRDIKPSIREGAVAALQAALVVTSQRETKESQQPTWYKQCYKETERNYDDVQARDKRITRDDWAHGSLLIINELLRCSNIEGERLRMEMEEISKEQKRHEKYYKELYSRAKKQSVFSSHAFHSKSQSLRPALKGRPATTKNVFFESRTCKMLIADKFDKICRLVLKHKASKNAYIQQAILALLPRLCAFQSRTFIKSYLDETISYLVACLKKERERSAAYQALGLIAIAVQRDISKYLKKIMVVIKQALPPKDLPQKKLKSHLVESSMFTCISMLTKAVRTDIEDDIRELLEPMLSVGLSPALIAALRDLSINIPTLKKPIQGGLLNTLSLVLMGHPFVHPGAPKLPSPSIPQSGSMGSLSEVQDVTSITLALKTLGNFDFEGHSLTQFVRHAAEHFLSSDHKEVRMEAVKTCSRLLTPLLTILAHQRGHISMTTMNTVADVLNKLLVVGITDLERDIRTCVLISLDERFDPHLAQAENLATLFVAINDETFEIRELAMCIIGRLSNMNPAYVMPSLRMILIQLLTELGTSGMVRNKEQAAKMLSHLVSTAPILIKPYMEAILKVLVPKLQESDQHPSVTISVLAAIGEQAQVSGIEMIKWMDELLPIIMEMLQDSSAIEKREVSLWTLGQLIESTGYVVVPYKQYPTLLEVLLNFLKTEQTTAIRRETMKVLGLLGALDPYKHKINLGVVDKSSDAGAVLSMAETKSNQDASGGEYSTSEMLINMSTATLEEFYPAIAISMLMRIIRDPSLSQHHNAVVQAITFIFKSLGIKCVPYLQQVLPAYLLVIGSSDLTFREFLFQQLGVITAIVKQHIRIYLDEIFEMIKVYWTAKSPMQSTIILLIEQIVLALGSEFKVYLPLVIPQILRVLTHDSSTCRTVTAKLMTALQLFGANLEDYLHLVLPPLVKLFDSTEVLVSVRKIALETVDRLTDTLDLSDYSSRIIHPLVRTIDTCPELRHVAMDTLSALVMQLGKRYQIFIPMVNKILTKHKVSHQRYDLLLGRILKLIDIAKDHHGSASEIENDPILGKHRHRKANDTSIEQSVEAATIKKLHVNAAILQKAWQATRRVSKDDWMEWLRKLNIELMKESPSPALRSCWALAHAYNPLARELFNAAFVSCWTELSETQQDELIQCLEQAFTAQDIPEITQTLLNLAEFMEHCDKGPLPLSITLLGERAIKCRAYAKALHYKEEEFHTGANTQVLGALISINNKLHQSEAAAGVLEYAMKHHRADLKVQETWYEKLHEWTDALAAYERKQETNPNDVNLTLGRMRCLEALGEWGQLNALAVEKWPTVSDETRHTMARMAAAAAWGLEQWECMEEYSCMIARDTYDGAFYRAVLAIQMDKNYSLAQQCIDKARDMLDTELTAMVGESYSRAYGAMVNVQILSELEEIIQYKLVPERRDILKNIWWDRLQGCQRIVEDWQKIIQVRSLVISAKDDMRTWLKYASLCRKSGRLTLSHTTLVKLLGVDPSTNPDQPLPTTFPQVTFAYMKLMWKNNQKKEAFEKLSEFVNSALQPQAMQLIGPEDSPRRIDLNNLMAKCYLKMGSWIESLQGVNETSIPEALRYYSAAMDHDRNWYKAWHSWACMNYEAVLFYKQQSATLGKKDEMATESSIEEGASAGTSSITSAIVIAKILKYCVPAITGFVRSISLSKGHSLQDTLRLLTLWFDYGQWQDAYDALVEGIKSIDIDNWLQVIPQLIARIDTPRLLVGRLIQQLLMDIGKQHPQALIYPLTVASKSKTPARQNAANKVLDNMCEHSNTLVKQANLVSEELIRVAILWHEMWHEALEDASRLYFGEKNIKAMFATLDPLHAALDKGPQTLKETSFNQAYGRDLGEARNRARMFHRTSDMKDMSQAWDLYYHVFRRIAKQLPQLTSLELQYVSPKLLMCRDLELAVPGTYDPHQPIIRISHHQSSVQVIISKQRPRKLSVFGSNGQEYTFLLKGHEDLRQDERVMQLFGLVNSLLMENQETFRRNLTIQRFSVIPLSTNSGLIGWVPHSDTLHSLIRDHRDKKKILLNIEHRIMLRMAPDYDHLTLMQKVEVFEHALEHTNGDDLAKILWNKSPSSEVWFDRRTNYTRSLAVMSMVGYILGLGDRHPSNLMLDRMSGKITHIDFGDCFEVAMMREKYPEKIPFRLTRMLTNAVEVTGIDGNYKMTCKRVMEVLRENKDSLMAVLEAFVYDPLLNWRLMDTTTKAKRSKNRSDSFSGSQDQPDMLSSVDISQSPKKPSLNEAKICEEHGIQPEARNKKAIVVINRVRDKLTGKDFSTDEPVDVPSQVELLIKQATSHENLCQCYIGWCPFW